MEFFFAPKISSYRYLIFLNRIIGGYLLSLLNNFDLCFGIDNNEDNLCGFVLTINESEKYDKFIQRKWIEQLHQKYPNVDQVNHFDFCQKKIFFFLIKIQNFFELIECPQWIYDRYSVRVQFFIDLTIKTDYIYHLGNKLMKIIVDNLIKRGFY